MKPKALPEPPRRPACSSDLPTTAWLSTGPAVPRRGPPTGRPCRRHAGQPTKCSGPALAALSRSVRITWKPHSMPGPLTCFDGPLTLQKSRGYKWAALSPSFLAIVISDSVQPVQYRYRYTIVPFRLIQLY